MAWKNDCHLKCDLEKYVHQSMKRTEILDFINQDYSHYFVKTGTCSLRTLARMLAHFNIKYIDYSVSGEAIKEVVKHELNHAGTALGYRALTLKIRQEHGLNVPRDVVYGVMTDVDQEGLIKRRPGTKRKKNRNKNFVTEGVNWFYSIDGHDKLMGYQNSTFPIAVYGIMDQASRKILLLKCWTSNSDPRLIGRWYLDWIKENRVLASNLRMDRGTETGKLASIHAYLRGKIGDLEDPTDSIVYGPSTSNQVSLTFFFKTNILLSLWYFECNLRIRMQGCE